MDSLASLWYPGDNHNISLKLSLLLEEDIESICFVHIILHCCASVCDNIGN